MKTMPPKILRVFRGEIYYADMTGLPVVGSEQAGTRPVMIVQNDVGNYYSPTVIAVRITSSENKAGKKLPTHMTIDLRDPSTILCEQIITISKERLREKIGKLPDHMVDELNEKLMVSLGIVKEWE